MSDRPSRPLLPGSSLINDLTHQVRLIARLMADSRVPFYLKALPVGSLLYLLFPDLAPGPIDDALIIWLGTYLFVELCPPEVVQEHRDALHGVVDTTWRDLEPGETKDE